MNLKTSLVFTFMLFLSGISLTANADFFSGPFDWWDNNDDYDRYSNQGQRSYGRDRWKQYDEWEPDYWRYRFFDNDSNDRFYDRFDGNHFGYGRNDFNFDMNMGFDGNSRYDGDYENDYRFRDDRRGYDNWPAAGRSNRDYGRRPTSSPREYEPPRYQNEDQYNDEYWRNYSRRHENGNNRGGSSMYERGPRR